MSDSEAFELVAAPNDDHKVFVDYEGIHSAHGFDPDTSLQAAFRKKYPELALTVTSSNNGNPSSLLCIGEQCLTWHKSQPT